MSHEGLEDERKYEGLEDERKWMTDTESVFGESLFYHHFARTLHTGAGNTWGRGRCEWDGASAVLASA
jgi:hypothetical protein